MMVLLHALCPCHVGKFSDPQSWSHQTLLTAFDGRSFRSHGILPDFEIKLAGKVVSIEVEVIDAPLDYNLLLGRSWNYAMSAIALAIFRVVVFPHEGKLVTVDQLDFTRKGHMESNESTVPLVD